MGDVALKGHNHDVTIGACSFRLGVDNAKRHELVVKRSEVFLRDNLARIVEAVTHDLDLPHDHVVVPRIELDLGRLSPGEIERQIEHRLSDALRRALGSLQFAPPTRKPATLRDSADFAELAAFLEFGGAALSGSIAADPAAVARRAMLQSSVQVRSLLLRKLKDRDTRRRIANQFEDRDIYRVLRFLLGDDWTAIVRIANAIEDSFSNGKRRSIGPASFRVGLRIALLRVAAHGPKPRAEAAVQILSFLAEELSVPVKRLVDDNSVSRSEGDGGEGQSDLLAALSAIQKDARETPVADSISPSTSLNRDDGSKAQSVTSNQGGLRDGPDHHAPLKVELARLFDLVDGRLTVQSLEAKVGRITLWFAAVLDRAGPDLVRELAIRRTVDHSLARKIGSKFDNTELDQLLRVFAGKEPHQMAAWLDTAECFVSPAEARTCILDVCLIQSGDNWPAASFASALSPALAKKRGETPRATTQKMAEFAEAQVSKRPRFLPVLIALSECLTGPSDVEPITGDATDELDRASLVPPGESGEREPSTTNRVDGESVEESHSRQDQSDLALPKDTALEAANSGLVLLWPFVTRLCDELSLLEDGQFKSEASAHKAAQVLHYLASGTTLTPEPLLLLPKMICGLAPRQSTPRELILNKEEIEQCEACLQAAISAWKNLSNTSIETFRESFLQRNGILTMRENHAELRVERKPYDLLLSTLPWQISVIRLRWMTSPIHVDWS
ncbi:MAG: contractile injection system tape measure protein [Paracoccaceae bacterium]|nr:contractile injection system tape measure protein [Paracoccaceae bacterium]